MAQHFTHVAVTVPSELLREPARAELLAFYEGVFGWTPNAGLSIPGERIFLRAPVDDRYPTVRASDAAMRTSSYEHLGVAVDSAAELRRLHERARAARARDGRVELGDVEVECGGHLHSFRVRYRLPVTIEVQYLARDGSGAGADPDGSAPARRAAGARSAGG